MELAGGQEFIVDLLPDTAQRIIRNLALCLEFQPGSRRVLIDGILVPLVIAAFDGTHIIVVSLFIKAEAKAQIEEASGQIPNPVIASVAFYDGPGSAPVRVILRMPIT